MELDVDLRILIELRVQLTVLELGEHLPQLADLLVARLLGDQRAAMPSSARPGGDQLDHLLLGLAHDINPTPRYRAHKALALELRHGLADRRARDTEVLRQGALVEAHLAGPLNRRVDREDHVLEGDVGALGERRGVSEGRERDAPPTRDVAVSGNRRVPLLIHQLRDVATLSAKIPIRRKRRPLRRTERSGSPSTIGDQGPLAHRLEHEQCGRGDQ